MIGQWVKNGDEDIYVANGGVVGRITYDVSRARPKNLELSKGLVWETWWQGCPHEDVAGEGYYASFEDAVAAVEAGLTNAD